MIVMMGTALVKSLQRKSGSVAVSTAIIAPVLILIMSGVVDLGRATYDATSLAGAVRAGGQYAIRYPDNTALIQKAAEQASTLKNMTVVVSPPFCECPNGTSSSCSVSVCGAGVKLRKFVRVSATSPFSNIMPSSSIVVPSSLSAESVVRAQ